MDRREDPSIVPPVNPPQQQQQDDEKPIKKRTKTGCQTCRARRVKCDEGKPECNNCIKSRRQCEGINPADQRILTSALGYGMGTGSRGDGGMKKSRRHAPYAGKRMYTNIVPAPPKELDSSSAAVVSSAGPSRSPKRKRDREPDSPEEHIGICAW